MDCRFNVVNAFCYNFTVVKFNSIENSTKAEYTEVTVTDTKGDDVSCSYVFLIVLSDESDLCCSAGLIVVINAKLFAKFVFVFLGYLSFKTTFANNSFVSCINSSVVDTFIECPEVTRCECGVPKFFTFLATVLPLIIARNESFDNVDNFGVVVIKFKEPVKVFNSHTGHSELCMVNFCLCVLCKPVSKLISIRLFAISFNTGVELITVKTVTVSHGVAKRNILNRLFCNIYTLVCMFCCANCGSNYANEHKQRHENRKSFDFLVSKIHFCSFPSLKLDSV